MESLSCPYGDREQPQGGDIGTCAMWILYVHAGSKALSEFGANFFKSLLKLEKECATKRSEHLGATTKIKTL